MNFTVYARDAPGREPTYGNVKYTWQLKGEPDGKFTLNMRTFTVKKSELCREIFIIVISKLRYQSRIL